jgi:predicted GNAT superfamily acetyltransferase
MGAQAVMKIAYRLVDGEAEYRAAEELQDAVWGGGERDMVPSHMLLAAQKAGGLLLGAFDGAEMVGLVFGFLGTTDAGRLRHCSHLLAVLPSYQGQGIGRQLKLRQRAHVLAQGIDLITWTYDPLERRNAILNIAGLGAVCGTYLRDLYGSMPDALNAGLPSDRFEVEWWIAARHVERRLARGAPPGHVAPLLNPAAPDQADALTPAPAAPAGPQVAIRIPRAFQEVKRASSERAAAWRLQTRQLFEEAFAAGYTVVDLVARDGESHYLLEQGWRPD